MQPVQLGREAVAAGESAGAMLPSEALDVAITDPSGESTDPVGDVTERLALRVGNLHLLCTPDAGREVLIPPPASRLPHMPEWMLGVGNVRGALVPMVDFAMALGLECVAGRHAYLLISGTGEDAIGLLVDGLPVLQRLETSERMSSCPPHPAVLNHHVNGAFAHGGVVWLDIDIKGLTSTLADLLTQPDGGSYIQSLQASERGAPAGQPREEIF